MNKILSILTVGLVTFLASCSDADIVSGTYHGKIYTTDTMDATVKISPLTNTTIRIDITNSLNQSYMDIAELTKNNTEAYNLFHGDPIGMEHVTGFYYEGFIFINSYTHGYSFEGERN